VTIFATFTAFPFPLPSPGYGLPMLRTLRTLTTGAALAVALVAASLSGCSSSSSKKETQIPSEMLGPDGAAPAAGTAEAAATPLTASEKVLATDPATPPAAAPAAAAAPLTASEQAFVTELNGIMKEVNAQFERLVVSLEQAGKDCKKAAAALSAGEKSSAPIDQKMNAFKAKLEQAGKPSDALMSELRKVTLSAFPPELRTRAETTVDGLDKQCAADPDFKKAKEAAAAKQAGG
jgi:hypothetical protein